MNATKMTLIATVAVLALYIFAVLNSGSDNSDSLAPDSTQLQTTEN